MSTKPQTVKDIRETYGLGFGELLKQAGVAEGTEFLTGPEGQYIKHANPSEFFSKLMDIIMEKRKNKSK